MTTLLILICTPIVFSALLTLFAWRKGCEMEERLQMKEAGVYGNS
ncbi:hypothetical protein [Sporolactobacillus sp. STSJ-5]|nr:hypothetical protein [Sporolactobacillus sp. STSJ-5]